MDASVPVDTARALRQWSALRAIYAELGHEVEQIDPVPELPDMVFTVTAGLVIGHRAFGARFAPPERTVEARAHARWGSARGLNWITSRTASEGEGDFLLVCGLAVAGSGFRTDPCAPDELRELFDVDVLSVQLVDPRFYQLDLALMVLGDDHVAYFLDAFAPESLRRLRRRFPSAIEVPVAHARSMGLNGVSDGQHVFLPSRAAWFARTLRATGYDTIEIDLSELQKAGGGVKCCTLDLHPALDAEAALTNGHDDAAARGPCREGAVT